MSITEFIYTEYSKLLDEHLTQEEIHQYFYDQLEHDQIMEIWRERYAWIVGNIFREVEQSKRKQRQSISETQRLNAPQLVTSQRQNETQGLSEPRTYFGERRYDISFLQDESSLFLARICVDGTWMLQGEMTQNHWRSKATEYGIRAKHAKKRAEAASAIADRIPEGKTTKEALTEDQFKSLLPEEGF